MEDTEFCQSDTEQLYVVVYAVSLFCPDTQDTSEVL